VLVNGQMQIDHSSLILAHEVNDSEVQEVVDESGTKYVTSASYRKMARVSTKWTKEQTELFYNVRHCVLF
jgi:hypothetical protein